MSSFSQDNRLLRFKSIYKPDFALPERVSGFEGISTLFRFEVDLLSPADKPGLEPFDVVGTSATIGIRAESSGTERLINGMVASFELCGGDAEFFNYRAVLVPKLWTLTLNKNTRVFEDQSVIDVIKFVLQPYSITLTDDTTGPWPIFEYCTQYRETDFHFIARLMEQHGILYYFKHTEDAHTLTLQDVSSSLGECPIQDEFRYAPQPADSEGFFDFVIRDFSSESTLVTGKFTAWDHSLYTNSRMPAQYNSASTEGPLGNNENESYDYADSATSYFREPEEDKDAEKELTLFQFVRRNASDSSGQVARGTSNAIPLAAGFTFTLKHHPQNLLNVKYLVTRVEHTLQQLPSYRSRTAPDPAPYSNRFTATHPFRYSPPLLMTKPKVQGLHTGIVAVREGEDSELDEYGRVAVHFWWDRVGSVNFADHSLLRVAQSWAGKGWGTYFWPRAGDEVLIGFIEGDPDQPIIVGSVYNGVNMPKYAPNSPEYTLSGILTRSSKNGSAANANELRFEDLKGKEQIFMNAERDYDLHVENTWHTLVGNEQHTTVGSNRFESIGKNSEQRIAKSEIRNIGVNTETSIGENQLLTVGGNVEETIGVDQKSIIGDSFEMLTGGHHIVEVGTDHLMKVANNWAVKAVNSCTVSGDQNVNLTAGNEVVIQSDNQICLTGPGGFITIGPAGVIIQGNIVMINSGGVALPLQSVPPISRNEKFKDVSDPTKPAFPGDDPPSKR